MSVNNPDISSKPSDDYKSKYTKYKELLNASTFPSLTNSSPKENDTALPEIISELRKVLDLIDSGSLEEPFRVAFLNDYLPSFVKLLVSRKFSDVAHYRLINQLFCHWMYRRLNKLELRLAGDATVLRRIFSHKKPFYDPSSLLFVTPLTRDLDQDCSAISYSNRDLYAAPTMEKSSPAYWYNVNCFGQLGGFQAVLKIFATSDAKSAELKFAKRIAKSVANMAEFMDKDQWSALCIPVAKSGVEHLGRIGETELRQVKPAEITKFTRHLQRLLKVPGGTGAGLSPVEEVELGIAMRLCHLPSLERKLTGIGIFMTKLGRLPQKFPSKEPNAEAGNFAEWLKRNDFIGVLFGESIREELLKRAGELLVFMYAWGKYSGQEIADLWDYAISKSDTTQTAVLQLIESLAIHLSRKDAFVMFGKIRQLPLPLLKENTLGVLSALARNEYYRNKKKERKEAKKPPEENKLLGGGTIEGVGKVPSRAVDGTGGPEYEETKTRERTDFTHAALERKRARDDSATVEEKRHTRTGSGDQTKFALRPRLEIETEPFIPDDEAEGDALEPYDVLNYIWSLTNEGAVRGGLTIQPQVIELFLTLLNRFHKNKCADYLQICEGMLASDNSFTQCSKIYMKIVETLGHDPQWKLQTTTEDFLQKMVINLIKFKRVATQKGMELLAAERSEEEECMDTQSSIEEKNAREGEQFPVIQVQPMVEDVNPSQDLPPKAESKAESKEPPAVHQEEELKEPPAAAVLEGLLEAEPIRDIIPAEEAKAEPAAEDRDIYLTLTTNSDLKLTYYQELDQRLELLKFLVIKGKQPFKAESIPLLWQTLLINSFSAKEVAVFFEFMHAVIRSETGLTLVASHVFDSFFFEILLKLDQCDYPLPAFHCLKEMIIALNITYKHITVSPTGGFEITDIRLIGFEAVWEIALQARDKEVQKAATDLLHEVYKRLSADLSQKQGAGIREEFLMKCMAAVKSGGEFLEQDPHNQDYVARVGRSLELLHGYIVEFESRAAIEKASKAVPDYEYEIIIMNNCSQRGKIKVRSTMKMKDLLGNIKDHYKLKHDIGHLVFLTQGRVIYPTEETIYENGIREDMTINVTVSFMDDMGSQSGTVSGGIPGKSTEFSEDRYRAEIESLQGIFADQPREIVVAALRKGRGDTDQAAGYLMDDVMVAEFQQEVRAAENARLIQSVNIKSGKLSEMVANNEKYFGMLYQLLSSTTPPELTEKAWQVIQSIPINPKMLSDILAIKSMEITIPWDVVYSLDSPHKFCYHLRIIDHILKTTSDDSKYEWLTCFVMLDGLCELCNTVATLRTFSAKATEGIATTGKTFMDGTELALKIIRTLVEASLVGLQSEGYQIYQAVQVKNGATTSQDGTASSSSAPPSGKCSVGIDTESPVQKDGVPSVTANKPLEAISPLIIKDEVAGMVLEIIKRQDFVTQLLNLLNAINVPPLGKTNEKSLSEGVQSFVSAMLIDIEAGFQTVYSNPAYHRYLRDSLLGSDNENLKATIIKGLTGLFTVFSKIPHNVEMLPPDVAHLDILLGMLPEVGTNAQNSETYFGFVSSLMESYQGPNAERVHTGLEDVVRKLVSGIKGKLQAEVAEAQDDKQLAGYMKLLSRLADLREDSFALLGRHLDFDLVSSLCSEIFGAVDSVASKAGARKCAIKGTMRNAVTLLLALCKKSPEHSTRLLPYLAKFHEAQLKCTLKDIGVDVGTKAPGSYVGLKNFGCTCYINSLLQQLYMMPEVRYKLLGLDPEKIAQLGQDRVTANLQKIFATLQMSKQQYYPPNDFCKDFKESDGKPINVCVQQDVDEFFNRLAERLEGELKVLGEDRLLKEAMEVVLLQEISSLEPDISYTSYKEDPCLALPLDIKGRKSIEEALDFFVKEEILEGDNKYYCEDHARHIRASKKCVLKKLPRTLVLNLKRFEFDYATMQKKKLNDYCEFPFDLNLYKWTHDSLSGINVDSPEKYSYELVGVLVHSGTAEGGHYYSYIKERETKSPNRGKWFEFNDTRVQPFNPEDLKKEAFGTQKKSTTGWFGDASAYLLVYQKAEEIAVEAKGANEKFAALIEQESEALTNTRIYLDTEYAKFVREYFKTFRPEPVAKFTAIDSDTFEIKKNRLQTQSALQGSDKSSSLEPMTDTDETVYCEKSPSFTMCKLAVLYANDLITKTKDTAGFKEWVVLLMPHIKQNSLFALWLIKYVTKHKTTLFDLLIECNASEIRELFKQALEEAVKVVATVEEPYMRHVEKFLCPSDAPNAKKEKTSPRAASVRFIILLLTDGLNYARSNFRKFDEFFSVLTTFASLGTTQTGTMISYGAVYSLIDFVANTPTPLNPKNNFGTIRPTMGDTLKEVCFRLPVQLLSVLVRSCSTSRMRLLGSFPRYALFRSLGEAVELPEFETEFLFSAKWNYLGLVYQNKEDMTSMLIHLTWEDEVRAKEVISGLTRYVFDKRASMAHQVPLEVLKEIITAKDGYLKQRWLAFVYTEVYMRKSIYEYLEYYRDLQETFVVDILSAIAEISSLEKIAEMIREDKARLQWAPEWLEKIVMKKPLIAGVGDISGLGEAQKKAKFVLRYFAEQLDLKPPVVVPMTDIPPPKKTIEGTGEAPNGHVTETEKFNDTKKVAEETNAQNNTN